MFWTAGARYRSGNPKDYIKWDGRRWTLNGMQPKCYFQNMADTPLPPQSGWALAEMPVTAMPTLTFGSVRSGTAEPRNPLKNSAIGSLPWALRLRTMEVEGFSFSAVAGFSLVLCLGYIDWTMEA